MRLEPGPGMGGFESKKGDMERLVASDSSCGVGGGAHGNNSTKLTPGKELSVLRRGMCQLDVGSGSPECRGLFSLKSELMS